MKPTEIACLTPGMEGFTVEAIIGIVFDRRDGTFGPTQDLKVKDTHDAPREAEVTLRLRDREILPREARGRAIIVTPGEYKGKRTGVKWNIRTAADGRVFPEIVVSRSAKVTIQDIGEIPALAKTQTAPAATAASPTPPVPSPAPPAPPALRVAATLPSPSPVPAPSPAPLSTAFPPRNGNGNGKTQYTVEDLIALADYFAPRILALSLPETAVGIVLDGLLRVATVTGTRPPQEIPAVGAASASSSVEPLHQAALPPVESAPTNVVSIRRATGKQVELLRTLARQADRDDAALLAFAEKTTGRRYDRLEAMTIQDASRLIEAVRKALREMAIQNYAGKTQAGATSQAPTAA